MLPEPPKTGRHLYRWARETEHLERCGLVKYLDAWARLRGWPRLWADWTEAQVAEAYAEAVRMLSR